MNRGEGLKIAAKAKHGTGLFPEEKKTKKKFSYKSRAQAFPVRKLQTDTDSKDLGRQSGVRSETTRTIPQGKYQKPDKNSATRKNTQMNTEPKSRSRDSGKKVQTAGRRREAVDFIKKNKSVGGSNTTPADETSLGVGGADTIALTQAQLNAILQSIGAASGETPVIAIENGQVKVRESSAESTKSGSKSAGQKENGQNQEDGAGKEQTDEGGMDNRDNDDRSVAPSENLLQLLGGMEIDSNKAEKEAAPAVTSTNVDISYNDGKKDNSPVENGESIWGSSGGMGNIGAIIGSQRELSAQERKKLEWKRALDEQIAEKRRQKEQETALRRSLDKTETDIFHQQPPRLQEKIDAPKNSMVKDPVENVVVRESSLGRVTDQSHIPAAMRSSFFIGGSSGPGTEELKKKEKQEWVLELERQRREAVEIKERQKRKQQEEDARMGHWTDTARPSPRNAVEDHVPPQIPDHASQQAGAVTARPTERTDIISPRQSMEGTFTRGGFNSLVDPAEQERRDIARRKHAEHMQAVQQQVEEKQRKKREADERRRQEEAMEERRLAAERDNLQKQFDMEKEKQRKKEEEAAAKQRALEESIFNAQQEALAAKHARRVQRLNQQGHDTSHLRESWDAQQHVQASPRQVVHSRQHHQPSPMQVVHSSHQHQPIQHSPPPASLVPNGTTQTLSHDSLHASTHSGSMKDAATSTISDQSTQTGLGIDSLPPGILEVIRQASAGIEYRGGSLSDEEPSQGQVSKRGKKAGSAKTEESVGRQYKAAGSTERKGKPPKPKKNVEKPRWGQSGGKKKVSNSDKDLSKAAKGREERRRRRQEELLAQQERLARRRDSLRKPPPSGDDRQTRNEGTARDRGSKTDKGSPSRITSRTGQATHRDHASGTHLSGRGSNSADYYRTQGAETSSRMGSRGGRSAISDSGAVEGDFYPFLRSEDIQLTNRSVTPDREGPVEQQLEMYVDTSSYTPQPTPPARMDPLLNPECLKDTGQRQERILEQLSHLRQGLMMKQREIELGLTPTII